MKLVGFFSQTAVKKNHAGTIAPCTPDGRFDPLASVAEILTPHWFSKFFGFADKSGSKLHDSISIVFLAGAADNITGILPLVISRVLGFAATFWCVRLTDASVTSESLVERKGSYHFHPEPCAGHREVSGEASVGACAGRAIEPRNAVYRMCRDCPNDRRQHFTAALG